MVKVKKDLTGMVFGRLTVLQQAEDYIAPNGRHSTQWLCECSTEAIKARLNAELKYYGEFAPQRHLFQEYEINILKEGRI